MSVVCNTLKEDASDAELQKFLKKDDMKGFLAKYDANAKQPQNNANPQPQNNANPKK